MRKSMTKAETVAACERDMRIMDARNKHLQESWTEEKAKREAAERKLALYERLDRVIAARAKERFAEDEKLAQLGMEFEVMGKDQRGRAVEREVCTSEAEAAAQVLSEIETAVAELNEALEEEVTELEAAREDDYCEYAEEREMFLRALGMTERQWLDQRWKWRY